MSNGRYGTVFAFGAIETTRRNVLRRHRARPVDLLALHLLEPLLLSPVVAHNLQTHEQQPHAMNSRQ